MRWSAKMLPIPGLTALLPSVSWDTSEKAIAHFGQMKPLKETVIAKSVMQTSDNGRFLRFWFEIQHSRIGYSLTHDEATRSEYKWFPYNKGIGFRKWYGNNDYIVNFYYDGEELKYWLVHNPKDPGTKHWSRNMRNYDYYNRMLCKQITKSGDSVNLVPFTYGNCSSIVERLVCDSVAL